MCELRLLPNSVSSEVEIGGFSLDSHGITAWLASRKIVPVGAEVVAYRDEASWDRAGGETYLSRASVVYQSATGEHTVEFVLKALVGLSPERQLGDWTRRRQHLLRIGIPVSSWFDTYPGIIIEPFYEFDHTRLVDMGFLNTITEIGARLDANGFHSLNYLRDLRGGAGGVYYIDFGFDLGEPGDAPVTSARNTLLTFCTAKNVPFPSDRYDSIARHLSAS